MLWYSMLSKTAKKKREEYCKFKQNYYLCKTKGGEKNDLE